jgi:hypothetical protein
MSRSSSDRVLWSIFPLICSRVQVGWSVGCLVGWFSVVLLCIGYCYIRIICSCSPSCSVLVKEEIGKLEVKWLLPKCLESGIGISQHNEHLVRL